MTSSAPRPESPYAGPLAATQRRHWLLERTGALGNAYHVPVLLACRGPVSLERLRLTLLLLVARHAVLRTTFPVVAGEPVQLVGDVDVVLPRCVDLSGSPAAHAGDDRWLDCAKQVVDDLLAMPFDLHNGPLFRLFVLRRTDDECLLLFDIHHAVCDAWSLRLIRDDFERLYAMNSSDLAELDWEEDLGYLDYARERLERSGEVAPFWRDYLAGATPYVSFVPGDEGTAALASERLMEWRGIDAAAILSRCANAKVTVFVYLQAILHLALRAVGAQADQLTGTVVAGRRDPRFAGTVGCFVNYLPIRTRSDDTQSFTAFLADVRDDVLAALDRQDDEFERIVACAPIRGAHVGNPLFNVALVVQNTGLSALDEGHRCGDLSLTPVAVPSLAPSLDLRMVVTADPHCLRVCLEIDERALARPVGRRLEGAVRHLLDSTARDSMPTVGELLRDIARVAPPADGIVRLMASFPLAPLDAALTTVAGRLGLDIQTHLPAERAWMGDRRDRLAVIVFDAADWTDAESVQGAWAEALYASLPERTLVIDASTRDVPASTRAEGVRDMLRQIPGVTWQDQSPTTDRTDDFAFPTDSGLRFTRAFHTDVALRIARELLAASWRSRPVKVLVLDCDNTLWRGLCGEDGADGVSLGSREMAVQSFALRQRERGVLLCVCSRNRAEDVMAVFEARSDMLLKPEHVTAWAIAWEPKSRMLARLATTLGLSTDSFVFVDDEAAQVGEVRHVLPEVRSIHVGLDLPDAGRFLENHWAFDTVVRSGEAVTRRDTYAQAHRRDAARSLADSHDAFMRMLDLRITVRRADLSDAERVAELAARTNQFNLSGDRLSSTHVEERIADPGACVLVASLVDRFGDYGTVGAVLARHEGTTAHIEQMYLSCRALERGVELIMVKRVAELGQPGDGSRVAIHFRRTARNLPAMAFVDWLAREGGATVTVDGALEIGSHLVGALEYHWNDNNNEHDAGPRLAADDTSSLRWPASIDSLVRHGVAGLIEAGRDAVVPTAAWQGEGATNRHLAGSVATSIRALWNDVLRLEGWDSYAGFFDLGGSSLAAMEMLGLLRERFGVEVPVGAFFARPTVDFLVERIGARAEADVPVVPPGDTTFATGQAALLPAQRRFWILQHVLDDTSVYHLPIRLAFARRPRIESVRAALRTLVSRHPALRARIVPGPGASDDPRQHDTAEATLHVVDARDGASTTDAWAGVARRPFRLDIEPPLRALLVMDDVQWQLWFVLHHVAADARTIELLADELNRLIRGEPLDEGLSWVDYAQICASHQARAAAALPRGLAYWHHQLAGHRPSLDLPRPSAETLSPRTFRQVPFHLSLTDTARLGQVAKASDTTLFVALLVVFGVLLHRYTRQRDMTIGTTVDTREGHRAHRMAGCFVNTLPLRLEFDEGVTANGMLRRVRTLVVEALAHREVPYERIVDASRSSGAGPTEPFEAMFQHLAPRSDTYDVNGSVFQSGQTSRADAAQQKFGLCVLTTETPAGIAGVFEYDTARLDGDLVEALAAHFANLAASMPSWLHRPVADVPVATGADRARLDAWNDTRVRFPGPWTMPEMFLESATRDPGAIAIVEGGHGTTYGELHADAARLALALRHAGLEVGRCCAISVSGGAAWVTAALAIQFAGGAFVPLGHDWPLERRARVIAQADIGLLVSDRPRREEGLRCRVVDMRETVSQPLTPMPLAPADPRRVAYVIFTSGSTGVPKGVVTRHAAVCNTLMDINERFAVTREDRILALSSFGFDLSIYDVFGTFAAGAAVVIPTMAEFRTPAAWRRLISDHGVTLWDSVPALFEQYLSYLDQADDRGTGGLRLAFLSGDRIPPKLPDHAWRHDPRLVLHSLGGATEASIWSIAHRLFPGRKSEGAIPYGRPLRNQAIAILDERGLPCPPHVVGEICIGGDGLAEGYIGDTEQTAARFPTAFDGRRWYRTGDYGVFDTDGVVHILGRMDSQVKVNGHRIECGDVEAALLTIEGVEDAIVRVDGDGPDRQLAAYVVARTASLSPADLDRALRGTLPSYMVPRLWRITGELPRAGNDKLDLSRLPAPEPLGVAAKQPPPGTVDVTPTGQRVLDACAAAVPGQPAPSLDDDFFAHGGDSLRAITVTARLSAVLGREVSVRLLYAHPRLEDFSHALDREAARVEYDPVREVQALDALLGPPRTDASEPDAGDGPSLLTGATGFLGLHMLEALQARSTSPVWCLVRCRTAEEGMRRLVERAHHFGVRIDASRVVIVPSDIAEPGLGLEVATRDAIVGEVRRIYHSAARVDFLHPYRTLKSSNVMSMVELGRLALSGRGMFVHFVSSRNVLDAAGENIQESMYQPWHSRLADGYSQSKWTAEQLIGALRRRGVRCAIYRPSRIVAALGSSGVNADEFFNRVLRATARLGLEPGFQGSDNLVPVDYAATAIVALSLSADRDGEAFHVQNENETQLELILDRLRARLHARGRAVVARGHEEWLNAIARDDPREQPLYTLLPLLQPEVASEPAQAARIPGRIPAERTHAVLRDMGIRCPVIDAAHIDHLIELALA